MSAFRLLVNDTSEEIENCVYSFQIPRIFYSLLYNLKAGMQAKFQKALEINGFIAEVVYIFIQAENFCETHFV